MLVNKNENCVFYDIDDTLAIWQWDRKRVEETVLVDFDGWKKRLLPHKRHIELMKLHKQRGFTIVVWSQGGYGWAEAVIKALQLENMVDFIFTKPHAIIDDLPPEVWITNRIYLEDLKNNDEISNK